MLVTLLGMFTLVILVPEKILLPMLVTLLGMFTLVRLVQPEKALSPMLVTLLGMVTLVRPVQLFPSPPEKALFIMLVKVLPERSRLTYFVLFV